MGMSGSFATPLLIYFISDYIPRGRHVIQQCRNLFLLSFLLFFSFVIYEPCLGTIFYFENNMNQYDDGGKANPTGSGKAEEIIYTKETHTEKDSREACYNAIPNFSNFSSMHAGLRGSNSIRISTI